MWSYVTPPINVIAQEDKLVHAGAGVYFTPEELKLFETSVYVSYYESALCRLHSINSRNFFAIW